jgi:hypothetical protein
MTPAWSPWLQGLQAIFCIAAIVYTWFSNQRRADRNQVIALEAANRLLEQKVAQLDEHIKHMPCEGQWSELHAQYCALKATADNQNGWLESIARKVDRIDDWLRENK